MSNLAHESGGKAAPLFDYLEAARAEARALATLHPPRST